MKPFLQTEDESIRLFTTRRRNYSFFSKVNILAHLT